MAPSHRAAGPPSSGLRGPGLAVWTLVAGLFLGCAPPAPAVASGSAPPVAPAVPEPAPSPLLARLSWLAGCWERTSVGGSLEEQWMAPRGGMMLGMNRMVRDGRAVAHEALRIEERQGALVYVADPSGQTRTEFTSVEVTDTSAVWENPEHDFPQRIVYRKGRPDSLFARAEAEREGAMRGVDFRLGRVACPAGGSRGP